MKERYFLPILLGLTGAAALVIAPMVVRPVVVPEADPMPDPSRARFMLECVQDFQNTPETCVAVWAGADPPQQADGVDIPGC